MSVLCCCSDFAVWFAGVPASSRAVLRQKARYSTNPHEDTARCRHLPIALAAREGRNTASINWVSAYAPSPAISKTSGTRPHAGATAACTAPALLAGAPATPVDGERESEGKVADQEVDRAAAGQAQPANRAQPHTRRAPRHSRCSSIQRRSGAPAQPISLTNLACPSRR